MCSIKQVFYFLFLSLSQKPGQIQRRTLLTPCGWSFSSDLLYLWRQWWRNLLLKSEHSDLLNVYKYPHDIFANFQPPATCKSFLELTNDHKITLIHLLTIISAYLHYQLFTQSVCQVTHLFLKVLHTLISQTNVLNTSGHFGLLSWATSSARDEVSKPAQLLKMKVMSNFETSGINSPSAGCNTPTDLNSQYRPVGNANLATHFTSPNQR